MSDSLAKVQALMRLHQFKLIRHAKHHVYTNPEGRVFVTSSTPSDFRFAHNQLTSLKRCLASPPMPMVLAISEYEREQAAAVIQARPKATVGVGSGKHHRSRGTGFIYEDKILTAEQLAEREKLAEIARAAGARRQARRETRRASKLEREAQKQQQEAHFQEQCGRFLARINKAAHEIEDHESVFYQAHSLQRAWDPNSKFYEFLPDGPGRVAEDLVHEHAVECIEIIKEESQRYQGLADKQGRVFQSGQAIVDIMDSELTERKQQFSEHLSKRRERITKLMTLVDRALRPAHSAFEMLDSLKNKMDELRAKGAEELVHPSYVYLNLLVPTYNQIIRELANELAQGGHPTDLNTFADVTVTSTDFIAYECETEDGAETSEVLSAAEAGELRRKRKGE